jgi:hypothetical protein
VPKAVSGMSRKRLVFNYLRFKQMARLKKVCSVSRRRTADEQGDLQRREHRVNRAVS